MSSQFILMFQDPKSPPAALDGQQQGEGTDIWEPEAAGEVELWNEIAGYSIRGAPGSRMSQSDRTKGLNSPLPSQLLLCRCTDPCVQLCAVKYMIQEHTCVSDYGGWATGAHRLANTDS